MFTIKKKYVLSISIVLALVVSFTLFKFTQYNKNKNIVITTTSNIKEQSSTNKESSNNEKTIISDNSQQGNQFKLDKNTKGERHTYVEPKVVYRIINLK